MEFQTAHNMPRVVGIETQLFKPFSLLEAPATDLPQMRLTTSRIDSRGSSMQAGYELQATETRVEKLCDKIFISFNSDSIPFVPTGTRTLKQFATNGKVTHVFIRLRFHVTGGGTVF